MCILPHASTSVSTPTPAARTAHGLPLHQRQALAVAALAGAQPLCHLAQDFQVSRKFVYRQCTIADQALHDAFAPPAADPPLFSLPVTKHWLQQLVLALVLTCHSPLRGVVELLRDVLDYDLSLGTVFNTVRAAVAPARQHHQAQDLSRVRVGGHDEIFQTGQPVLVGIDLLSTYCYLLSREDQRDAETWAVHLLDLQQRGFAPDFVVADGGNALRAAQQEVLPTIPCRSDVFHAFHEVQEVVTKLENRAYEAMTTCAALQRRAARYQQRQGADRVCLGQLRQATANQERAIALADDVALLAHWLRHDVLALAGPSGADRLALYDFICAELQVRVRQAPHLLGRLVSYLRGQRDNLLAFAAQLDDDFAALATRFAVPVDVVRELWNVQTLASDSPKRWQRDAPLRHRLRARYFALSQALHVLRQRTVRASALVENYNSRLRSYFTLRRHLGNDYLSLLQFYLNHRRYPRSEHRERVGKSPAELLTGQNHPHWLELLGYSRLRRN